MDEVLIGRVGEETVLPPFCVSRDPVYAVGIEVFPRTGCLGGGEFAAGAGASGFHLLRWG